MATSAAPWMSSLAGMVGHTVSTSLHPLENVKLRFQASDMASNNPIQAYKGIYDALKTMYRQEGILSLYRGAMLNIIAGSLANSIFFYIYTDGKQRYGFDQNNPNSWSTIFISLRAGVISTIITCPLWVVKARLALYKQSNVSQSSFVLPHVVKDMLLNEGPTAFYKGLGPGLVLSTYGIIQMYTYENLNLLFGFSSGRKLSWDNFFVPFFVGGFSKSIASFTLMPLNVVRLRLQMKQYSEEQVQKLGLKVDSNQR